MLNIKVLSYKSPQRYAVKKTLVAAQRELQTLCPGLELTITELTTVPEMLQYTQVLILPSLVINEKLVCVGRFPKKEEVVRWLLEGVQPGI